jgi:hypothetical protein
MSMLSIRLSTTVLAFYMSKNLDACEAVNSNGQLDFIIRNTYGYQSPAIYVTYLPE